MGKKAVEEKVSKKETPVEATATKKKSVIRRKHISEKMEPETEEDINLQLEVQAKAHDSSLEQVASQQEMYPEKEGEKPGSQKGGLRIVSVPEAKEVTEVKKEAPARQELFQEKVHKFTPVYTPPKVEKPGVVTPRRNFRF